MSKKAQKKTNKGTQKKTQEKPQNKLQEILSRRVELEKFTFWRIFAAQVVLFFAIYGIMLAPRFSTDSYSVFFYTIGGLNGLLGSGRPGTYLLFRALLALGLNSVTLSPIFTAVFILTVSWSAAVLLTLLKPYFSSPSPNWLTVLLLELGIMQAYANIYFAELYFFSDVALNYTFATFFLTLALVLFCHRNQVVGAILALVCLFLSLSFYQAFLGFFMIFGAMMTLLRHDIPGAGRRDLDLRRFVLDLLRLAAVGGGGSFGNVLLLNRLAAAGLDVSRGPSLHIAEIIRIIRQAVAQFHYFYPMGYPDYLTGLPKLILVLAGPVLLCLLAVSFAKGGREDYPFSSAGITLLVLFCGLLSVFAPHFISQSVWVSPRSICSFFAVFAVAAVVIGRNYLRDEKAMPWAGTLVLLLLLIVNIVGIQGIALDQMEVNRQDKAEMEEIIHYIQRYEEQSGQTVDTISWTRDNYYTPSHPEIKYTFMDMNVRAAARSWSLIDCINYYSGRRFKSEYMPEEVWEKYFRGQEWDFFRPEEQIRFEGNKMYLMVY